MIDHERDTLLREGLAAAGLDGVLAWHTEEVVLTTGKCPHLGATLCLYPREGEPVVYTLPNEHPSTLPDHLPVRMYELAGSGAAAWEGLHRLIAADASRLGLRRVGYAPDAGRHAVPGNAGEGLAFGERTIAFLLDGLEAVPSDLLPRQMLHKTAREVEAIRRANAIAGVGLRAFYAALQPGLTEAEVAARVEGAIQARTGRDGVDVARAWAYIQAAANTQVAGGISRSSGYVLQEGDYVLVELGTFADGYWSDLTRSGVVGEPSAAQAALLGAVREAQGAAIAAIRPGVSSRGGGCRRPAGAGWARLRGRLHPRHRASRGLPLARSGADAGCRESGAAGGGYGDHGRAGDVRPPVQRRRALRGQRARHRKRRRAPLPARPDRIAEKQLTAERAENAEEKRKGSF